jgi:hypothetical protein
MQDRILWWRRRLRRHFEATGEWPLEQDPPEKMDWARFFALTAELKRKDEA